MQWRWRIPISFRIASFIFGGAGLVLVGVALWTAFRRHTQLQTWPRTSAAVDSGDVAGWDNGVRRQALYAARLWVRYESAGSRYAVRAVDDVYTSNYSAVIATVENAKRLGHVPVMLDPSARANVTLNPGYTWRMFFIPLVTGGLGLLFLGFGFVFRHIARRQRILTMVREDPATMRQAIIVLAVMGVLFLAGAIGGFYALRTQRRTWVPTNARVDSADVVWKESDSDDSSPSDLYGVRLWLGYSLAGREYHAPLTPRSFRSDSAAVARNASEQRGSVVAVLVDPKNGYDVVGARGRVTAWLLPLAFALPGVICVGLAGWLLARGGWTIRHRARVEDL